MPFLGFNGASTLRVRKREGESLKTNVFMVFDRIKLIPGEEATFRLSMKAAIREEHERTKSESQKNFSSA